MMAKPKGIGQITVTTKGGPVTVDAYALTDHLAAHRPLTMPGWIEDGYMLSHRATGYSITWVETLRDARRALKELDRPELHWGFTTPLASVVLAGCCTRLSTSYRIRERATGIAVPAGRFHGHRLQAASA